MKNHLIKLTFIRKRERKSLILVSCILFLSSFSDDFAMVVRANFGQQEEETKVISYTLMETSVSENEEISLNQEEKEADLSLVKNHNEIVTELDGTSKDSLKKLPLQKQNALKLVRIDPNEPNLEDLLGIGIPPRVARTWKKYTEAGGTFYKKEDLLKVYGMNDKLLSKIKDRMIFPQKLKPNPKAHFVSVYINQASASDFSKISGIGPTLSARIVKFRDRLGGFHSIEQLNEVYGIDSSLVRKNFDSFLIEKEVVKININTSNAEQLAAHIYCTYRIANAIVNYRIQHGNFTDRSSLDKLRMVDKAWIDKISPYLEY